MRLKNYQNAKLYFNSYSMEAKRSHKKIGQPLKRGGGESAVKKNYYPSEVWIYVGRGGGGVVVGFKGSTWP